MEKALAPVAEVIEAMVPQASQAAELKEWAPEPSPVLLEVPSVSPSPGASNMAKVERASYPSLIYKEILNLLSVAVQAIAIKVIALNRYTNLNVQVSLSVSLAWVLLASLTAQVRDRRSVEANLLRSAKRDL